MPIEGPRKEGNKQFLYLQEFACRVDSLLQALLSREGLNNSQCSKCNAQSGKWRCKDCLGAQPLCRLCMRQTHIDNPFHRIEKWTGKHFQAAGLWEVGVYIRLRHRDSTPACQYMQWQEESYISHNAATAVPLANALNNTYVRVIHTNGVHHLALATCSCTGMQGLPEDLIHAGLMPTSFKRVRTIFTLAVLDQFRYSNLEMKASAYQFFEMLRRITMPMTPAKVVNFYHELRRLSRVWRWMKKLKWAGLGHKEANAMDVSPGELAIFCPACPQPGINLPHNWLTDPNCWVYRRFFVADGNFKADHVKQNQAGPDLWLSEGGGMMTRRAEYKEFLRTATERLTKAPCENTFRAIEQAMLFSKSCDITGIVAIACARHGCFAPNSIVDLTRGEQQKNVDWAFLEALRTTSLDAAQGVMLIYDIACQYFIHMNDRIGTQLPIGLEVDRAIGLFHVHAHKEACFFRYASSFIPGTGVCAGEILESLWSNLNTISPATWTATLAHRAEIIDDHATDSNHSKTLAIGTTLTRRFKESLDMVKETTKYYDHLTSTAAAADIAEWSACIIAAEAERLKDPAVMDILAAREPKCHTQPEPVDQITPMGEDWCRLAIAVEERQIDIQDRVRRLGKEPREEDRQDVERLRGLLVAELAQVVSLQTIAVSYVGNMRVVATEHDVEHFENLDEEGPQSAAGRSANSLAAEVSAPTEGLAPECQLVSMPSNTLQDDHPLRLVELSLRKDQAARYLQALREVIADKSFHFSDIMRLAPKKSVRTRARTAVGKLNHRIALYSRIYRRCRLALINLSADQETLHQFQLLQRDDVMASTVILDPNRPGASSLRLSWIWQSSTDRLLPQSADSVASVQRVHWLRARAQNNRWNEEHILVGYEMEWSVRYFLNNARVWEGRSDAAAGNPGAAAYAARQVTKWRQVAASCDHLFQGINPHYVRLVT
ncbi:hypothetical protein BYT27DRAFT_7112690 [Phlegmacium glaucopus]|nr:hypothetical protein BYT27DRAFT_7112690 [Phlegmacium glaucopus]